MVIAPVLLWLRLLFLLVKMYACPCYQSPGSECFIRAIPALPYSVAAKVTWPELQLTSSSQPSQMVPSAHFIFCWCPSEGEDITSDIHKQAVQVSSVSGRSRIRMCCDQLKIKLDCNWCVTNTSWDEHLGKWLTISSFSSAVNWKIIAPFHVWLL